MRVGVEVGGTFTDLIAITGDRVTVAKVPSVRAAPEEGVFAALEAAGIPLAAIDELVHGSTVATNAVLERKGALTAFVTTAGFTDTLLIQRQDRREIYDLHYRKPEALVARRHTLGLDERTLADGTIERPLEGTGWESALETFLARAPFESVAISLLNAYANPAHELRVAGWIAERHPNLRVTCSHEVNREFREYERASTTVLSAYVQPVIASYLGRLERRLAAGGFKGRFSVMQSNGGRLPADAMRKNAVTALFSGPAGGVAGALRMMTPCGVDNFITLDMGGTSTDVCLVTGGQPVLAAGTVIDGLPIRTPVVDIATVGAGGGSIIRADDGGMIHAGPRSAGANPGPACYARGGTEPTVTDAHLVRGTLRSDRFLGGKMRLDGAAAERAFADLARTYGVSTRQMADNAIRLADANIARAVQQISTALGVDPRDYVIVPFGGAGPLHAVRIAEALGVRKVIVPQYAGVLSALGLVVAEYSFHRSETRKTPLDDVALPGLARALAEQQARIARHFDEMGMARVDEWRCTLQMRFVGQAFEIDVPVDAAALASMPAAELRRAFAASYRRIYSTVSGVERPLEIVGYRLGASVANGAPVPERPPHAEAAEVQQVPIYEGKAERTCAVLDRARAKPGLAGPLLVVDDTSTCYVPPGWTITGELRGNLVIESED